MKVLKKPDNSTWLFTHKCNNCECTLEVDAGDLRFETEEGCPVYIAFCIVCEIGFNVPTKDIPRLLQIETIAKTKKLIAKPWMEWDHPTH